VNDYTPTAPSITPPPSPHALVESWDRVAEGYAADAEQHMLAFSRDAIALARPSASARVLDVAAGPGVLALAIAKAVARVDAVDFSPAMLKQLELRRAALGIHNVFAQRADGQALPFEAQSFDAAFWLFGLMFFASRGKGFAELYRVLVPGGVAVVSSWAPVERSPLMLAVLGALRAADPSVPAPRGNGLSLENPRVFEAELAAAGFDDVVVAPHEHGVKIEDARTFWEGMSESSASLAAVKARHGAAEWRRRSQLAIAHLESHVPIPCELTTTAYLGFGRRR
jgi:SAM-dependent methyltransferase